MLPRYCTWVICRLQKLPLRDRGHVGFAHCSRAVRALRPKRVVRSRGPRNRPSGSTPAGSGQPLSSARRRR
jgi:hypothetical protein